MQEMEFMVASTSVTLKRQIAKLEKQFIAAMHGSGNYTSYRGAIGKFRAAWRELYNNLKEGDSLLTMIVELHEELSPKYKMLYPAASTPGFYDFLTHLENINNKNFILEPTNSLLENFLSAIHDQLLVHVYNPEWAIASLPEKYSLHPVDASTTTCNLYSLISLAIDERKAAVAQPGKSNKVAAAVLTAATGGAKADEQQAPKNIKKQKKKKKKKSTNGGASKMQAKTATELLNAELMQRKPDLAMIRELIDCAWNIPSSAVERCDFFLTAKNNILSLIILEANKHKNDLELSYELSTLLEKLHNEINDASIIKEDRDHLFRSLYLTIFDFIDINHNDAENYSNDFSLPHDARISREIKIILLPYIPFTQLSRHSGASGLYLGSDGSSHANLSFIFDSDNMHSPKDFINRLSGVLAKIYQGEINLTKSINACFSSLIAPTNAAKKLKHCSVSIESFFSHNVLKEAKSSSVIFTGWLYVTIFALLYVHQLPGEFPNCNNAAALEIIYSLLFVIKQKYMAAELKVDINYDVIHNIELAIGIMFALTPGNAANPAETPDRARLRYIVTRNSGLATSLLLTLLSDIYNSTKRLFSYSSQSIAQKYCFNLARGQNIIELDFLSPANTKQIGGKAFNSKLQLCHIIRAMLQPGSEHFTPFFLQLLSNFSKQHIRYVNFDWAIDYPEIGFLTLLAMAHKFSLIIGINNGAAKHYIKKQEEVYNNIILYKHLNKMLFMVLCRIFHGYLFISTAEKLAQSMDCYLHAIIAMSILQYAISRFDLSAASKHKDGELVLCPLSLFVTFKQHNMVVVARSRATGKEVELYPAIDLKYPGASSVSCLLNLLILELASLPDRQESLLNSLIEVNKQFNKYKNSSKYKGGTPESYCPPMGLFTSQAVASSDSAAIATITGGGGGGAAIL